MHSIARQKRRTDKKSAVQGTASIPAPDWNIVVGTESKSDHTLSTAR